MAAPEGGAERAARVSGAGIPDPRLGWPIKALMDEAEAHLDDQCLRRSFPCFSRVQAEPCGRGLQKEGRDTRSAGDIATAEKQQGFLVDESLAEGDRCVPPLCSLPQNFLSSDRQSL